MKHLFLAVAVLISLSALTATLENDKDRWEASRAVAIRHRHGRWQRQRQRMRLRGRRHNTNDDDDDRMMSDEDPSSTALEVVGEGNDADTTEGRRQRKGNRRRAARRRHFVEDLYMWIDEQQVKNFSGIAMEVYAISNGTVHPLILDPNFDRNAPVIPAEVVSVNFTWKSRDKKYFYNFDQLQSFQEDILQHPVVSVKTKGSVPRKPKTFSVYLPCSGNVSGIASFSIGLLIETRKRKPLPGTPLRLRMRKECTEKWGRGPDPECDKKCANNGYCDTDKKCKCPPGFMGQYCTTVLCFPQCQNGGNCTQPGVCSCPPGYQGRYCEGGICRPKCLNGGKCIQKDTCKCTKGYYGPRCEFSFCVIPCRNRGKCNGINKCRCPKGYSGDHCEIKILGIDTTSSELDILDK